MATQDMLPLEDGKSRVLSGTEDQPSCLRVSPERRVGRLQENVPLFSREAREARKCFFYPSAV